MKLGGYTKKERKNRKDKYKKETIAFQKEKEKEYNRATVNLFKYLQKNNWKTLGENVKELGEIEWVIFNKMGRKNNLKSTLKTNKYSTIEDTEWTVKPNIVELCLQELAYFEDQSVEATQEFKNPFR